MKICKLIVRGYQQFENTDLDFTDPATGEPANRICLIGRNGTGKSTVLRMLDQMLKVRSQTGGNSTVRPRKSAFLAVKLQVGPRKVYILSPLAGETGKNSCLGEGIESISGWADELVRNPVSINKPPFAEHILSETERAAVLEDIRLKDDSADLLVYAPSETQQNSALAIADVPDTNLDKALHLFKSFPVRHVVSNETISEMWRVLVYLVKKRDSDRDAFENLPENLQKTKAEFIAEFDLSHPKPLESIATLWNQILDRAGLEFLLKRCQAH